MAALIAILAFSVLWATLSTALDRVFPWMTVVQGLFIGLAIRRAGRGLDWRFPVIAAVAAVAGALVGNIIVAAAFTANELGTGTLTVLGAASDFTWPVFFDEVMTAADAIYALAAAGVAAYFANRRLSRDEYASYRAWQDQCSAGDVDLDCFASTQRVHGGAARDRRHETVPGGGTRGAGQPATH